MDKKINYLKGSARKAVFKNDDGAFDEVFYISLFKGQINEFANEKGYTSIQVRKRKDGADPYGNTHYMVLVTPEEEEAKRKAYLEKKDKDKGKVQTDNNSFNKSEEDELPF
jgi:hypothetical protein